jgi:hypothetical protein
MARKWIVIGALGLAAAVVAVALFFMINFFITGYLP